MTDKNADELIKAAAQAAEQSAIQNLSGTDKTLMMQAVTTFAQIAQVQQFSLNVKNFFNVLVSGKGDIREEISKCNQNDLGLLRELIIEKLKQKSNLGHEHIFKSLLDLIEANHFLRVVH